MQFEDIFELVQEFKDIKVKYSELSSSIKKSNKVIAEINLLNQQLSEIRYKLELPYKILDLLFEASKNDIRIEITKNNQIDLYVLDDYYNRSAPEYYLTLFNTQHEFSANEQFVEEIRQNRLEEERRQQLKQTALSKLTEEEIEVLGLN